MSVPSIGEVMTPFPYTVNLKDSVAVAQKLMAKHSIRHLPVISEGKPYSIVSQSEINLVLRLYEGTVKAEEMPVGSVCAMDAYIVSVDELLDQVLKNMLQRHISSAVVVNRDRLAGIFTTVDAMQYLYNQLQER